MSCTRCAGGDESGTGNRPTVAVVFVARRPWERRAGCCNDCLAERYREYASPSYASPQGDRPPAGTNGTPGPIPRSNVQVEQTGPGKGGAGAQPPTPGEVALGFGQQVGQTVGAAYAEGQATERERIRARLESERLAAEQARIREEGQRQAQLELERERLRLAAQGQSPPQYTMLPLSSTPQLTDRQDSGNGSLWSNPLLWGAGALGLGFALWKLS